MMLSSFLFVLPCISAFGVAVQAIQQLNSLPQLCATSATRPSSPGHPSAEFTSSTMRNISNTAQQSRLVNVHKAQLSFPLNVSSWSMPLKHMLAQLPFCHTLAGSYERLSRSIQGMQFCSHRLLYSQMDLPAQKQTLNLTDRCPLGAKRIHGAEKSGSRRGDSRIGLINIVRIYTHKTLQKSTKKDKKGTVFSLMGFYPPKLVPLKLFFDASDCKCDMM